MKLRPALRRAAALAFTVSACVTAQEPPPALSTVQNPAPARVSSGALVIRSVQDLDPLLKDADYVLVGERHDHPGQHLLQAQILARWTQLGKAPAVVFEQLDDAQNGALQAFLATHPKDASALGAAVKWNKSGWPSWVTYQPIADVALRSGLPIVAGLFPRKLAHSAAAMDLNRLVPAAAQHSLGLDQPEPAAVNALLTDEIIQGHCHLLPADMLPTMVQIQRARDGTLAQRMVQSGATRGALLIAGAEHARKDMGVPRYLNRLAPKARVLSIGLVEQPETTAQSSATLEAPDQRFDAVWYTERLPEEDHCAALKKQLKK